MAEIVGGAELNFWPGTTGPSISTFTLNASNDAVEFVTRAVKAATITRLGFRQGSAGGTPPTYKISLQGVDGSGNPDGTIKGGGSPASATFTPSSGNNSTWQWITLDNSYAVGIGEPLAIVIKHESGTIDGSNNCSFAVASAVSTSASSTYAIQNDAGSRSRVGGSPLFGYGSASVAFGWPLQAIVTGSFSSASTPDEKAVRFTLPTTLYSTFKVSGARIYGNLANTGAFDLKLYDTDGTTVLQQTSYDTDLDRAATSALTRDYPFDDTPVTLNAGSTYRLSFVPTTGSMVLLGFSVASAADLDAYRWGSAVASGSTRVDGGSWTDDTLTRYAVDLILSDLTPPAGGGGSGIGILTGGGLVR